MGLIALIAFWGVLIQTFMAFGPKPPAVFATLWAIGFSGFPLWGVNVNFLVVYEAVLVIAMVFYGKVKNAGL